MKKLFLVFLSVCLATMLQAAVSKTVNLATAGTLSTVLTADELITVTDLTLTGNVDARDFATMRDAMKVLENIDMSGASIVAYTGTEGTVIKTTVSYPSNELPEHSFSVGGLGIVLPKNILKSIKLSNTVTVIGDYAFTSCKNLTSIDMSDMLTTIGINAFYQCSALSSICIPSSVTSLKTDAFRNCSGLKSIIIESETPIDLTNTPNVFLNIPVSISLYVPVGSKAAYTTATRWSSFTNIKEYDVNCTPGNLSTLLSGKLSAKSLTVIGEIDARDFKTMRDLMPNLASIDLSEASIVAYSGTAGTGGTTVLDYPANTVPYSAFCDPATATTASGKLTLNSIILPQSATAIASGAFYKCANLMNITLPSGLQSMGSNVFYFCSSLPTITLPRSLSSIGTRAFENCTSLSLIIAENPTPVVLTSSFKNVNRVACTLLIPDGSKQLYAAATDWKEFLDISSVYTTSSTRSLPASGSLKWINVVSQSEWTASSDQEWLHVSLSTDSFDAASSTVSFGSASRTVNTLWFTGATNTSGVSRTAKVSVVAPDGLREVVVTQAAAAAVLSVSTSTVSFTNATATIVPVEVQSNVAWTATSNQAWLHVSLSGGDFASASATASFNSASATTTLLWFSAATNTDAQRSATVVLSAAGVASKTITVNQEAVPVVASELSVTAGTVSFFNNPSSAFTEVTANRAWTATSNADWLNVSLSEVDFASASATASFSAASKTTTKLWFVVPSNTTTVDRSAEVTITVAGLASKVVYVDQMGVKPEVTLSENQVYSIAAGETKQVTVTSNVSWQVKESYDWLSVSVLNNIISVTSSVNTATSERTATINIMVDGVAFKTIAVTQAAAVVVDPNKSLKVSKDKIVINEYISTFDTIYVRTNTSWTTRCSATWIHINVYNDSVCSVVIDENNRKDLRTDTIVISGDGVADLRIPVNQTGSPAWLALTKTDDLLSSVVDSAKTVIASNVDWTVTSSADWLTWRKYKDTLYYVVSANTTTALRTATLTVSATGVASQTFTVKQVAAGSSTTYVTAPATATAIATASTVRIAVTANTSWSAFYLTDWIDVTQSATTGDGEMIIAVKANPTNQERVAKIELRGLGALGQMITLTQAAGNGVAVEGVNSNEITVYPNPATAYFTVNTGGVATVAVYTQAGHLLLSKEATSIEQISVEGLAAGTYIVKVTTEAGVTEQKLIKQ